MKRTHLCIRLMKPQQSLANTEYLPTRFALCIIMTQNDIGGKPICLPSWKGTVSFYKALVSHTDGRMDDKKFYEYA